MQLYVLNSTYYLGQSTTILHPHHKVLILPSLSSLRLALSSLSLLTTYLTCIVPWWLSGSVTGYKVDCSESVPAKPSDSVNAWGIWDESIVPIPSPVVIASSGPSLHVLAPPAIGIASLPPAVDSRSSTTSSRASWTNYIWFHASPLDWHFPAVFLLYTGLLAWPSSLII